AVVELNTSIESLVFFFSSRRRHTRFKCDWSSDVCSSDLNAFTRSSAGTYVVQIVGGAGMGQTNPISGNTGSQLSLSTGWGTLPRSEERRVGKECRNRGGR